MKKVSSILLAIDGDHDDQALVAEIGSLGRNERTSITVLSITESPDAGPEVNVAMSELQRAESETRSLQLEQLSSALSKKGARVTVEHSTGNSYLEIIRNTLNGEYDLVMKPAKHFGGMKRLLLSGTDVLLMSLCPIPVWIFQPTARKSLKKIAVAVDLRPDDHERDALVSKLLAWGKFIAESDGAELHVVHAWSLYRENSLRATSVFSEVVDNLAANKALLHGQWLHDALQQAGLDSDGVHLHVIKGEPRHVIPKAADELDIDLLVMGTVGRTGIPGFFIGNTADSVLRSVGCSVFAIKPDNFSTPVEATAEN